MVKGLHATFTHCLTDGRAMGTLRHAGGAGDRISDLVIGGQPHFKPSAAPSLRCDVNMRANGVQAVGI